MSNRSPEEPPDLLYAMNFPCGLGHKSEFQGAASKTVHALTSDNETLFNLRSSDTGIDSWEHTYAEFHGWAHTLSTLSALIDPKTESMKRFVYAPQYQGDMDGEFLVRAVHRCLMGIREQKSPFGYKIDVSREVIRGFIQEWFEKEPETDNWFERREKGHKAAFYLAPKLYATPFEVRRKFGFEDDQIDYMASQSAWNSDSQDSVRHGDHFLVERRPRTRRDLANFERHTYRDIIDVHDEGFAIMIDRIAGVIGHFQDLIWGAESEEAITKNLTGADVLNAFLLTNDIPQNPYFMREFGL